MSDHDPDPTQVEQTSIFVPQDVEGPPDEPPTVVVGGPSEEPPDRRPWIIVGVLALIVLVLLLLLLFQDDDDDDTDTSGSTSTSELTTTSSSSSTTAAPTTTEPEATTSSAAPVVTIPPDECADAGEGPATPGLAANTVYEAWVRGDKACADELMTDDALDELFDRDGTDADDEFQGCTEEDVPDPHVDCAFTYEGGSTHYLMNFSDTDGWQVFDIEQFAD